MKRLILFCVLFFNFCIPIWSQSGADEFESFDEMIGKTVVLYDGFLYYSQNGPFFYSLIDGKAKAIKEKYYYTGHDKSVLNIIDKIMIKNKEYLKVKLGKQEVYIPVKTNKDLLNHIISQSYWEDRIVEYNSVYGFVKYPSLLTKEFEPIASQYMGKYVPIRWNSVIMPQKKNGEIAYLCAFDSDLNVDIRTIKESEIQHNIQELVTHKDYEKERIEYDTKIEEENARIEAEEAKLDSTLICEAMIKSTVSSAVILSKLDIPNNDKDTLWFSIYSSHETTSGFGSSKKKVFVYDGYIQGKSATFSEEDLLFGTDTLSVQARDLIIRRGAKGVDIRKQRAIKNDVLHSESILHKQEARMRLLEAALSKINQLRDQKKIFIVSQSYAYSEYQFGLSFKFYNCYKKAVKYVEIKTNAYNQVGDLQKDYFGNNSKSVRCIGPIESGEEAEYQFDKLFWDEYDIIHHLTVVDIKITFMDGSVIRYSGKESVKQHSSGFYAEQLKAIIDNSGLDL